MLHFAQKKLKEIRQYVNNAFDEFEEDDIEIDLEILEILKHSEKNIELIVERSLAVGIDYSLFTNYSSRNIDQLLIFYYDSLDEGEEIGENPIFENYFDSGEDFQYTILKELNNALNADIKICIENFKVFQEKLNS